MNLVPNVKLDLIGGCDGVSSATDSLVALTTRACSLLADTDDGHATEAFTTV